MAGTDNEQAVHGPADAGHAPAGGRLAPANSLQAPEAGLNRNRLPRHIAIIMDGNGRWAQRRGLPRAVGHRAGVEALRQTVEACADLGIEVLTVYAFSTENWKRPKSEVRALMELIVEYLERYLDELRRNGVRIRVLGSLEKLPATTRQLVEDAIRATAQNRRLVLAVAWDYGGRSDIVGACRRLARAAAEGRLDPDAIDDGMLSGALLTAGLPDPDLIIRTSGEQRLSNFLLWQAAYAELFFTPALWPDFNRRHLVEALLDYQRRDRRFGGVEPGEHAGAPLGSG